MSGRGGGGRARFVLILQGVVLIQCQNLYLNPEGFPWSLWLLHATWTKVGGELGQVSQAETCLCIAVVAYRSYSPTSASPSLPLCARVSAATLHQRGLPARPRPRPWVPWQRACTRLRVCECVCVSVSVAVPTLSHAGWLWGRAPVPSWMLRDACAKGSGRAALEVDGVEGEGFGAVQPSAAWARGAATGTPFPRGPRGLRAPPPPGSHSSAGGAAEGTEGDGEEGRMLAFSSPRDVWGPEDKVGVPLAAPLRLGTRASPRCAQHPATSRPRRGEQQNRGALPPHFTFWMMEPRSPWGFPPFYFCMNLCRAWGRRGCPAPLPASAPSKPIPGVAFRASQSLM